jgi:hypothetical protein
MCTTSDPLSFRDSPGTYARRWVLIGFLGLFLLLCANPVYDAWALNRAGVLVNRVIVVRATEDPTKTGPEVVVEAEQVASALSTAYLAHLRGCRGSRPVRPGLLAPARGEQPRLA